MGDVRDEVRDVMARPLQKAPRGVEGLARVGFAAKGLLYLIFGGLTAAAAVGASSTRVNDQKGAFATILQMPFGQIVLAVLAAGLFGYAAWRILEAVQDTEGRGTDAKGIAMRLAGLGKAVIHIALGFAAARLVDGASRRGSGSGSDSQVRDWTATLLDAPFGVPLVIAVGIGLFGYAAFQLYRAWSGKFLEKLSGAPRWVERAGRFGISARGIVFAVIGWFVIKAATTQNAAQAKGFGSALRSIETAGYGPWLLAIVALGLASYGLFELAEARYRRIRAS